MLYKPWLGERFCVFLMVYVIVSGPAIGSYWAIEVCTTINVSYRSPVQCNVRFNEKKPYLCDTSHDKYSVNLDKKHPYKYLYIFNYCTYTYCIRAPLLSYICSTFELITLFENCCCCNKIRFYFFFFSCSRSYSPYTYFYCCFTIRLRILFLIK